MRIAIIVAMSKELALLEPLLGGRQKRQAGGQAYTFGQAAGHTVAAMECGIGKVNAALGAYALISAFKPDLVISTGVAGGADKRVNVMDVVVADQTAYHDVWCGPGTVHGEASGMPLYMESCHEVTSLLPESDTVKHGLICSGDSFIDSIEQVNNIKCRFPQALAVDMESAAIAHVCHRLGVKFFGLRVISDSPGASRDNAAQYEDFWTAAPGHTFEIVRHLLTLL